MKTARLNEKSVVQFYLRKKDGQFTNTKCIYMPARSQAAPGKKVKRSRCRKIDPMFNGHLVYIVSDGVVIPVKRDVPILKRLINWATFKRVK